MNTVLRGQHIFRSIIVALLILPVVCSAAEFTAEQSNRVESSVQRGMLPSERYRIFIKGNKVRYDSTPTRTAGQQLTVIYRGDKHLVWYLDLAKRTYWIIRSAGALWQESPNPTLALLPNEMIRHAKPVGKTRISGYDCDKYVFAYMQPSSPNTPAPPPVIRVMVWRSRKLKVNVRSVAEGATRAGEVTITQLSNIREQKLSDSLFEIPAGYRKIDPP
jgi:hypothetical protein